MATQRQQNPEENSQFRRVVDYFLGHEKSKDGPKKAGKRIGKPRKKPSIKAKKRA